MNAQQMERLLTDFLLWIRARNETFDIAYKDEPIDDETIKETVNEFQAERRSRNGWDSRSD